MKVLWLVLVVIATIGVSFFSLSEGASQKVSITTLKPAEQTTSQVTFQDTTQVNSLQTRQVNAVQNPDNAKSSIQKTGADEQNTIVDTKYVSQDESKKNQNQANMLHADSLLIAKDIDEKYVHYTPNFEFLIPSGWYIVQGSNSNRALFMTTNQNTANGTDNFVIVMSVRNLSEAATTHESLYNDCVNELSYKIVNKIPIRMKKSVCNDHNYEGYSFVEDKKIVTIAYITLPQGDRLKENDYEKLVSTLKVDDPAPVKDTWRQTNGFQIYHKKIPTADSEVEIKYYSVSQIDEFTVDLENKQIMLTVSETKDLGSIIIPISELFVKPYDIVLDGNKTDGVLIKDETDGISEIFVFYKKGTHTITISGNELVPDLISKSLNTPGPVITNPDTQYSPTNSYKDIIYGWIQSIYNLFN